MPTEVMSGHGVGQEKRQPTDTEALLNLRRCILDLAEDCEREADIIDQQFDWMADHADAFTPGAVEAARVRVNEKRRFAAKLRAFVGGGS